LLDPISEAQFPKNQAESTPSCTENAMARIQRFLREQKGATALEYALITALISIVILAGVNGVGIQLTSVFSSLSTQLSSENGR
jgi:pilus assembly protein Flp/PilA